MNIIKHCLRLAVALAASAGSTASAQYTFSTLVTFNGTNGSNPHAGLIADANGNLYGTTGGGGPNGGGTVFELAAGTHALNTLATFNDGTDQPFAPYAPLVADASGNLYGTTNQGGANGYGTVFEVAAGTHTLSTLVTFNGTNGAFPESGLIVDSSGNLYGTTAYGGIYNGAFSYGTVFEVAAGTHALATLATFNGTNGSQPYSRLLADASGNLYGTTFNLGSGGQGTVFKVAAGTHTLSTLVAFDGTNGGFPRTGLITDASGNLYGSTTSGGANGGTVFELAAGTHALSTLASFGGSDLLADASGNLYGCSIDVFDYGSVFELAAGTHAVSTLATFNNTNGADPYNLIADASGNLYGTTGLGGDLTLNRGYGEGTVFELSPVPEPSTLALAGCGLGMLFVPALLRRAQKFGRIPIMQASHQNLHCN